MTESETSPLDGLAWSRPATRPPCSFEAAGWSCRSTGFLWFAEARAGDERLYPCPRCNSELFLVKSRMRANTAQSSPACDCCGPGVIHLAYQSALEEARIQREFRSGSEPSAA